MTPVVGRTRPVRQLPEPARFWIAYSPRNWRSADGLWTDLANGRLDAQRGGSAAPLPELDTEELDDLLYLPTAAPELSSARDRLAVSLAETGVPVLVQLTPGERPRLPGVYQVFDLIEPLLEGDLECLAEVTPGSAVVWPLISGLTDQPEMWEEGLSLLAEAGAGCVQAVAVEIPPQLRRRLIEDQDEALFDAVFHGEPPSEREFARQASRLGMGAFFARPETGITPRQRRNRRIAAHLALAGELWLRLHRSVAAGQSLFRAARGAEATHHDLFALVNEDNLNVMDWLDAHGLEVVHELAKKGTSVLLEELLAEYLGR